MRKRTSLLTITAAGADASALIYSLIETAKANGLEPYTWLTKVMRELPKARKEKQWEHLLPWNFKAEDLIMEAYSSEVPT
jgi:glucan phosphorylase